MSVNSELEASLSKVSYFDSAGDRTGMYADISYPYRYVNSGNAIVALRRALLAQQEFAVSYRDFKVGATVMAFTPDSQRTYLFAGANFKVDKTDLINIHAEDIALRKARDFGCNIVSLLAIVGDAQQDHASGLTANTLHPCGRCRAMLGQSALINANTTIISSTPDLQTIDIYDLEGAIKLHETQDSGGVITVRLRPFVDSQDPEIDTDWDIDWQTKVTPILSDRLQSLDLTIHRHI